MSDLDRWVRANLPLEARTLTHALQECLARARTLGLDETAMARRLQVDAEERARLLEWIVPPESWLFRHAGAFEALRAWLRARGSRPVRMASLGCARGAEAYSMAAAAASVGRGAADTRIVAVDWNPRHLRAASEGHASPLAQRGPIPEWAHAFLHSDAQGWLRLRPEPMAMIEWLQADLVNDAIAGAFDVIFCRNVAIYLDEAARTRLAVRLREWAAEDALLCMGHADPSSLWQGAFTPLAVPGAFAFERVTAGNASCRVAAPAPRADELRAPTVRMAPLRPTEPSATSATMPTAIDATANSPATLERAQAQADAGLLREAADTLQELVSRDALRADAWALLGATRLGLGSEPEAEECFRRVVYLRPDDALALLQLSALAEARGDDATAHRLRARAARCDRRDEG